MYIKHLGMFPLFDSLDEFLGTLMEASHAKQITAENVQE
jgi:hypothetical protein